MTDTPALESEPMTQTYDRPGIYDGVSFETYCKIDAVNSSRLKRMSISPAHYKAGWTGETKALQFGRLAHCGKLEAASVPLRYAVMPPFELDDNNQTDAGKTSTSKATKYYKDKAAAFADTNKGREIVSQQIYTDMLDLLSALENHDRAREYLNEPGRVELTIIWIDPDTGLLCKARLDKATATGLSDLKTTEDAGDFQKSIQKFEYHRQGAHYVDGWKVATGEEMPFRLIAVSKTKPISVRAAPLHPDAIRTGRSQNKIDMERVAECMQSGEWPNHCDPDAWELPEWYVNRVMDDQLDMEGIDDA